MTIDELIEQLEEARDAMGGEAQVRIAYQPSWPLKGTIAEVTYDHTATGGPFPDKPADEQMLWLAAGSAEWDENPYAPRWAWDGDVPEPEGDELCPMCGSPEPGGKNGPCNTCNPADPNEAAYAPGAYAPATHNQTRGDRLSDGDSYVAGGTEPGGADWI